MSQQEQKMHENPAITKKPQDEEYDLYLFWPSLSSRDVSSGSADPSSSPLYGPVSLHSESTEYDFSGLSSGPPSPITFAHTFDGRFSTELDFGAASPDSPEAGAEAGLPKEPKNEPAKYSSTFKLGLILSQMTHLVYSVIDGVKIKMRKPRS